MAKAKQIGKKRITTEFEHVINIPDNFTEVIDSTTMLKDGRMLFTTNNGFKYYIQSQKAVVTEVTREYYVQAIKNKVK
jgi:hypothetical protein